jgi:hypothetical protein
VREPGVDSVSRPLFAIANCRFEINEDFAVENLVLERAFIDRRSVQPRDNASRNISLDLSGRPSSILWLHVDDQSIRRRINLAFASATT